MGASKPAARTTKQGHTHSHSHSDASAHSHTRPTLEPRIKHIPQATIRKKWKPLPQSSQDKIHSILSNLKTKRSGGGGPNARIPRVGKPSARDSSRPGAPPRAGATASKTAIAEAEYAKIVEDVASRLLSRLPRMPFPPTLSRSNSNGNAADDFDLSSTLARISTLQAQLTCNMQTSRLLGRQISREKAALKLDKKELKTLEDGLRGSRELTRRKERGLHPLAREGGDGDGQTERENTVIMGIKAAGAAEDRRSLAWALTAATAAATAAAESMDSTESALGLEDTADPVDPGMSVLLGQLRSHLLSMRNNTASLLPVVDAVDEAQVALEKFAARNLDEAAIRQLYGAAVV
ncbi:hypothetical protein G647_03195 [Cladophialophora carrionii CBS 160.54]|uniref:Kinetochore protein fta7 n=1 Tax=Cladophialophora carrionii CBS 160.54 TaxID=1279043 RepID=V9DJD6_9EURO|nr:uncharacterized protein G647_03195 [Cladophialophora carrionii CBS 160.54]ETI26418.1 hypothetical protein G647_03195 [Cladophialophora carrionii CBS 160.54]